MHGVGGGLCLHIASGSSKSWIQRITINGKRREVGLGGYPTVSLAKARRVAEDNRRAVSEGRDPLAERKQPDMPTFAEAAASVIELGRPQGQPQTCRPVALAARRWKLTLSR